jgi:hypothetical protein
LLHRNVHDFCNNNNNNNNNRADIYFIIIPENGNFATALLGKSCHMQEYENTARLIITNMQERIWDIARL